jgi:hypothetical protein
LRKTGSYDSQIKKDRQGMSVRLRKTGRVRHNEEDRQRVLVSQRKTEKESVSHTKKTYRSESHTGDDKTKSDRQTEEDRQRVIVLR